MSSTNAAQYDVMPGTNPGSGKLSPSGPNLVPDRFSDFQGPLFQHDAVPAFHEEARFGFGAGVTEQDAPALRFGGCFRLRQERVHTVELVEGLLLTDFDVGDELREARPAFGEL